MGQLRGKYICRCKRELRGKVRFWGLDKSVREGEMPAEEKPVLRFAQDDKDDKSRRDAGATR
jgi:hypothetical protein